MNQQQWQNKSKSKLVLQLQHLDKHIKLGSATATRFHKLNNFVTYLVLRIS